MLQVSRRVRISVQLEKDPAQRLLRELHLVCNRKKRDNQLIQCRDAQAKRGEEIPDPEAYQDPDDERNLFAGTVYEADDEEADRIWESVDNRMDARRRARR